MTHSNLISTVSADRSWKLWNIHEDHTQTASLLKATNLAVCGKDSFSSALKVVPSTSIAGSFISLSSTGELSHIIPSTQILSKTITHAYTEALNPAEHNIESAVACGDVDGVQGQVVKWARQMDNAFRLETLEKLLDMCVPMTTSIENWKFASGESSQGESADGQADIKSMPNDVVNPRDIISNYLFNARDHENSGKTSSRRLGVLSVEIDDHTDTDYQMTSPISDAPLEPGSAMSSPKTHHDTLMTQMEVSILKLFRNRLPPLDNIVFPDWSKYRTRPGFSATEFDCVILRAVLLHAIDAVQKSKSATYLDCMVPLQVLQRIEGYVNLMSKTTQFYLERATFFNSKNQPIRFNQSSETETGGIPASSLLLDFVPLLTEMLELHPELFTSWILRQTIEVILTYDYIRGIEIAKKVLECLEKLDCRGESRDGECKTAFADISHFVLFPTVYDDDATYMLQSSGDSQSQDDQDDGKSRIASTGSRDDVRSKEVKSSATSSVSVSGIMDSHGLEKRRRDVVNFAIHRRNALESVVRNPKVAIPMIKLEW